MSMITLARNNEHIADMSFLLALQMSCVQGQKITPDY